MFRTLPLLVLRTYCRFLSSIISQAFETESETKLYRLTCHLRSCPLGFHITIHNWEYYKTTVFISRKRQEAGIEFPCKANHSSTFGEVFTVHCSVL